MYGETYRRRVRRQSRHRHDALDCLSVVLGSRLELVTPSVGRVVHQPQSLAAAQRRCSRQREALGDVTLVDVDVDVRRRGAAEREAAQDAALVLRVDERRRLTGDDVRRRHHRRRRRVVVCDDDAIHLRCSDETDAAVRSFCLRRV